MANYDRLALLESEAKELQFCKRNLPFRDWYAVKVINDAARFFDSKRKALNFARKHYSPELESVRVYHAE